MQRPPAFFCACALVLFTGTSFAHAAEQWTVPITQDTWRELKVPGVARNQFVVHGDAFQIQSNASVSFRYFKIPKHREAPAQISWNWRVDAHSPVASQTTAGRDDRPLAVHIWFDDAAEKTLFGGIGTLLGYPKVGHLLTYVWGAKEPAGSVLPNPHYDKGKIIVLVGDDGSTGQWRTIKRDIRRDYHRAFGIAPDLTRLRYIAISADNDDLGGHSTAAVRAVAFHRP